ncbi:glycosyltransferase family 9 protein [Sphaerisporangium album]|uniref:Glycosyltransferase family 9 protein n=1 Tax=Sphaerisporangium album TaxID=509200 RepID=A0A367FL78_9ACTN|nr:glycosyltransferase family 9 protein [Sphaerisporangium album]RCG30410.1 glycosyltransferase family 9 protein [Sphaerisporangium album]
MAVNERPPRARTPRRIPARVPQTVPQTVPHAPQTDRRPYTWRPATRRINPGEPTAIVRSAPSGRRVPGRRPDAPVLLVLRGLGLGDLLTAVPALRALRRAHPGHRLVLAAPASLSGLVSLISAVDAQLDVSGPGPVPVERPDIAVNLHGRGPESIVALSRTRPGRLLTHAHPEFPGLDGPPWSRKTHEVRRWCDLLEWYGIAADPSDLLLDPPEPPGPGAPGYVVVHPGAASRARCWPVERFAEVAAALAAQGHRVLVTGDASERSLAFRVGTLAGLPVEWVLAGRTGLRDLAHLVAGARLLVCGDTGVAHLATAYATPSVVLFGPVSPDQWGPPPDGRHIALWAGRSGDPHDNRPDPGLLEIGTETVLDAALGLLEAGVAR